MTGFLLILTGFGLGFLHVLAGPDHLAAIAPLSLERPKRTWRAGFEWGCGHAGGVLVVGLLMLAFRHVLPFPAISSFAERMVGVVLLAIGLVGLRQAFKNRVHAHTHTHAGASHSHIHAHGPREQHVHRKSFWHPHAAWGIGTLHGVAGSSHLLGVMPALAMSTWEGALAYLIAFSVGTVAGMSGFSSALAWIAQYRVSWLPRLRVAASLAAMGVGVFWLVS